MAVAEKANGFTGSLAVEPKRLLVAGAVAEGALNENPPPAGLLTVVNALGAAPPPKENDLVI